jgi:CelD/BcsL family acetyltransferase involved in cellulose biosynthesis
MAPTIGAAATSLRVLRDALELERLRATWYALLARSDSNELMLTPDWLLTWWQVFGRHQGREMCALALSQGDQLIGLAPLLHRRAWFRDLIPLRRLEFLGSGERDKDGICSAYLNVVCDRGREPEVARLLARALVHQISDWDEVILPRMDGTSSMPALLAEAFAAEGMLVEREHTAEARYVPLPSSWDDYLRGLSKKNRAYVKNSLREFEDWAGSSIELHRVASFDDLEVGRRTLFALHNQRWQTTGGAFSSQNFRSFHDRMLRSLLGQEALELAWLTVRGQPVAAVYNAIWNNKVYCYQCGRRPDLPPRARAGIYLNLRLMQAHIEAGRREYDFLGGNYQYKRQLAPATRALVRVRIARPGWREEARRLVERGVVQARRIKGLFASSAHNGRALDDA